MLALMKVLLRDLQTGFYFGSKGTWVSEIAEAAEFTSLDAAGRKAGESGRSEVAVVLKYEQPACELALNSSYCLVIDAGARQMKQA